MGYGLPAAIAAALVHRDRPVVALVGDGGFAMTMAELETAVAGARPDHRGRASTTNATARSGCTRSDAERGRRVATELGPSTSQRSGELCGARGVRVEHDEEFEPALRQALADERSTVIQVALDRRWVSVDSTGEEL